MRVDAQMKSVQNIEMRNGDMVDIKKLIKDIKISGSVNNKVVADIADKYIKYGSISDKQEDLIRRYHYFHIENLGSEKPLIPDGGWITLEQINLIAPFSRKVQKHLISKFAERLITKDFENGYGIMTTNYRFNQIQSMFKAVIKSVVQDGKFYTSHYVPFRFKLR